MVKNLALIVFSLFWGFLIQDIVGSRLAIKNDILLVDIVSIIAGSIIPLFTLIFIYKRKFLIIILELVFLMIIGFIIQQYTYAHLACNQNFTEYSPDIFNDYLGFTILLPLFGFIFHLFRMENKTMIVFISIIMAIIVHIANFYLYQYAGGNMEQYTTPIFPNNFSKILIRS